MSGSAQAQEERGRGPQAAENSMQRLQAVGCVAAAAAAAAAAEPTAQPTALPAATAATFRLVERSHQSEWGSEMARIHLAWPAFTAAHASHVHAILVSSGTSRNEAARRYVCKGAGTQLHRFGSVADLQRHIMQQAAALPAVQKPKHNVVSAISDRSSQPQFMQQAKQHDKLAVKSTQQHAIASTLQGGGHTTDGSQSQQGTTVVNATEQPLQSRPAVNKQQHARAGAMQLPQPLKQQVASVPQSSKLWQRRAQPAHVSHKSHYASADHAALTLKGKPLLPVRDVIVRDQSAVHHNNQQPLLQHAERPALVQHEQHGVHQQAQNSTVRKVEFVRRGDAAWPALMNSIRKQWTSQSPPFNEEMEALLEFVRVALQMSGKAKGQGYKGYKVVRIQKPCESVAELQLALTGVGKQKSAATLEAPTQPLSSATQSSSSNLTRSISGPFCATGTLAGGGLEEKDADLDTMRLDPSGKTEVVSAARGLKRLRRV